MDLFTTDLFTKGILPFLLVFVLIFALLQKSKLLGEGKSQIDALLSLAVALILIAIPTPRDIIVSLIPWMAVALVVLFIVLVIYGLGGDYDKTTKALKIPSWFSKSVLVAAIVFVVVLVLTVTGGWTYIWGWVNDGSSILGNVLIIIVIGAALWVALRKDSGNDN